MNCSFYRSCYGKAQHRTRGAAEAHLRSLLTRGLASVEHVHTYPCAHGPHWHVGHKGRTRTT